MNTSGGFLLDPAEAALLGGGNGSTGRAQADADGIGSDDANRSHDGAPVEVRRLTQKQEVRLMNYLDDALLEVNRGYSKRYTAPASSQVPTLRAFLERYNAVLSVVASIPPIGPSAALLVSYLLRLTTEITDGIQGYDLTSESASAGPSSHARGEGVPLSAYGEVESSLHLVVHSIGALDRVWAAVLRGQMVDLQIARKNAQSDANRSVGPLPSMDVSLRVRDSAHGQQHESMHSTSTGRYPAAAAARDPRDSRSIVGSRGAATVAQTQRIRLRNIVVLAREGLYSWMRKQLDAPPPPTVDDEVRNAKADDRELLAEEGDVDQLDEMEAAEAGLAEGLSRGSGQSESDENYLEMIAGMDTSAKEEDSAGASQKAPAPSGEYSHYDSLFARKLDPDASDDDEDADDGDDDTTVAEDVKSSRKRSSSPSSRVEGAGRAPKLARGHDSPSSSATSLPPPPTDGGASAATLGGTGAPGSHVASVLRWDVAFAYMFARTLRALSDIQDTSAAAASTSRSAVMATADASPVARAQSEEGQQLDDDEGGAADNADAEVAVQDEAAAVAMPS